MKRIYLKRMLSITLAAVMAISVAACGKKSADSDSAKSTHNSKDYVYKETDLDLGSGVDTTSLSRLGKYGDRLYAVGYTYGEESIDTAIYTFNKDGSDVQTINIPTSENSNIMEIGITEDGTIYDVEVEYAGMDAGLEDGEIDISDLVGDDVEVVSGEEDSTEGAENTPAEDTDSEEATDSEATDSEAATDESFSEPAFESDSDSEGGEDKPEAPKPLTAEFDVAEADVETADTEEDSESVVEDTEDSSDEVNVSMDSEDAGISDESSFEGESVMSEMEADKYYIVKRNADGSEAFRTEIEVSADEYFYVSSLAIIDGKGLFIANDSGIHQYSLDDGSHIKDIALEQENSEYPASLFVYNVKNGELAASTNDGETINFYTVDPDAGTISIIEGATVEAYEYTVYPGIAYDYTLVGTEAIYGYNVGDAEPTMLLNFIDSDIDASGLYQMVCVSETEIFALLPSEDVGFTLALLTKVDPKDVKDKQIITLGCNYIDYDVRSHVVKFNKASDEYRIVITDYSDYETDDDDLAGANKLNTDIVSANAPDILVLDTDMPVDSYIAKGLFEDLTDYFNNDEELGKKEYISTMDAFKTDGKMYKIVPSFTVETVVAATEDVGKDDYTWTIDELEALIKQKNIDYKYAFGTLARDELYDMALSLAGSQFIDWDTLSCSYDSDAFSHLLEFINEFPQDLSEEDYETDESAFWREGKAIASRVYLTSFQDYNYEKKGKFGKDISFVGFPSDNGSGACLSPSIQLSMSSSSKVKDGCWQFMRYFLTDEYQSTIDGYWPVSMDQINKLAEQAKKKPVYIDETGKEVEYDDTYYIGDSEIIIDPVTDEEVKEVLDYLASVTQVGSYNDEVSNIISEESAAYFSGQKTAKEVADIIQSRVQIYVNEIS